MQKVGLRRITILVLMLCLCTSKALLAQTDNLGFTWKLMEVTNLTTEGKIQFTQSIPNTSTNVSWDFGDDSTAIGNNPSHTYDITTKDTFTVRLSYTLNSINSTITNRVAANSAYFTEELDTFTKASYVRILRSAFIFDQNNLDLQGNMRFEWSVSGFSYPNANDGQSPNIRYTFSIGETKAVTLRAWNNVDPSKSITFTRIIDVQPDFSSKVTFTNLPNVFTPNGDNVFDYFEVPTSGISRLVFKVFSRGGSLVYQNESTFIKWDGKNDDGKELPEGIYYYIIEDIDGNYENAKGFFYIFRGK